MQLIAALKTMMPRGYNMTIGGEGVSIHELSPSQRQALSRRAIAHGLIQKLDSGV